MLSFDPDFVSIVADFLSNETWIHEKSAKNADFMGEKLLQINVRIWSEMISRKNDKSFYAKLARYVAKIQFEGP